ncbi:MAG: RNA polymerase subunit sigma-70 [Intrasporangiaceae bacterium]|nr:RNA polymerase subunit sigma-70 [Intrasporangiaceae bacterium]
MPKGKPLPEAPTATLVADLVSSRTAPDRQALHARFRAAMDAVNDDPTSGLVDPLRITVGDEFQGRFETVGQALAATLRLRLALFPDGDIRFGVGWGTTTVLDDEGTQDGPGWWAAREAIDWVKTAEKDSPTERVRTAYRNAEDDGPGAPEVNAALLCRDHLVGSLDERGRRILSGMLDGQSQAEIAASERVSPSAISQRVRRDGIALILRAHEELGRVR